MENITFSLHYVFLRGSSPSNKTLNLAKSKNYSLIRRHWQLTDSIASEVAPDTNKNRWKRKIYFLSRNNRVWTTLSEPYTERVPLAGLPYIKFFHYCFSSVVHYISELLRIPLTLIFNLFVIIYYRKSITIVQYLINFECLHLMC